MRMNLSNDMLSEYFNVGKRTLINNRNEIGFDYVWLYNKFTKAKTIRERKDTLYSLKNKFDEDFLDKIWENYIERYEHERAVELMKLNKKINREIL